MKIESKPMMAEKEIEIIDDLLEKYKPKFCLEWGSGSSTTYFSKHKSIKQWLAIEHNGHYVNYLKDLLPDNANVMWIPDDEWYIDCVKLGRKWDFILVDGQNREQCLEVADTIINPGGIILLHDAGRREYQGFIKLHGGEKLIDGEISLGDYYAHRGLAIFQR